jgi:hypothetical protein
MAGVWVWSEGIRPGDGFHGKKFLAIHTGGDLHTVAPAEPLRIKIWRDTQFGGEVVVYETPESGRADTQARQKNMRRDDRNPSRRSQRRIIMNTCRVTLFVSLIMWLASPIVVRAADGGHLRLAASDTTPAVGQVITVDVLVEGAPSIYGADVSITFDPAILEVVDADANANGIQLTPGSFIDVTKSFVLQQAADNEKGTVDYALALLNPAPEVNGNGALVRVAFRAKAEGRTEISIGEGMYGTRTGETITPSTDRIEIKVSIAGEADISPLTAPIQQVLENNDLAQNSSGLTAVFLFVGLASGLGCLVLLVVWFRRERAG